MDGQLLESFPRSESIPHNCPTVKSIRIGRRVISILSCHPACCKLSVGQGRRKSAETGVLHQSSAERSGRTIPTDREVGFCTDHSIKKFEALLPSSCHQRHDKPPAEESNEQVRGRRTVDSMGYLA